ncbi:hypothetical protein [Hydrogenophaga pseudoflava]|uniref:Lipoprotein n=1 Tax=Hydrogenophaga pseudoflava TaxID=47421 RepID=A0A4P6X0A2_HYDPS|nr:hypothetical protein [Hydrogenophaga pseudoflava]QBM27976.1 hypothetical protein HPF_09785 [Hydrogenophaga pseudoflava]
MRHLALPLCLCTALLAGCDALGIESATQVAERKQAEAHAIGSACRHAIRSIEDCFKTNPKAGKAAVFAGWKEMDQYMRDNQIVGMPSAIESPTGEEVVEHEDISAQDEHASGDAKSSSGKKAADKTPATRSPGDAKTQRS